MLSLRAYLKARYEHATSALSRRRHQSLCEPRLTQLPRVGGGGSFSGSSAGSSSRALSPIAGRIGAQEEEEADEEETVFAYQEGAAIHACCCVGGRGGGGGDGGATWTAARLHGSIPGGLYAGLFDPIGGPECARTVAALSADYAAVAEMTPVQRRRWLYDVSRGHQRSPPSLATSIGGGSDGRFFLPSDLLAEHADAVRRLLRHDDDWWPAGGPTERLGHALARLDADMCSAALPSNDPCCVPAEWARPLARTGAVGCALVLAGRRLRLAQSGDCTAVIGSLSAGSERPHEWQARQPMAAHTIDNWREVLRVVRQHPDAAERGALFNGDRLLGELEPLRAFGRVRLKWPAALLGQLGGGQPPPPLHYRTPPYLSGEPEVLDVPLAPGTDRLVLLGTAALWLAVDPDEAVRCVGRRLLAGGDDGDGEGESSVNLASELVQLARRSRSSSSWTSSSTSSSSASSLSFASSGGGGGGGHLAAVVVRLPVELRGGCDSDGDDDCEEDGEVGEGEGDGEVGEEYSYGDYVDAG